MCRANPQVYGVKTVLKQLHREQMPVGRCTVARLMSAVGLRGLLLLTASHGRHRMSPPSEVAREGHPEVIHAVHFQ